MRILFICSSSEPNRDGVGDQVRLLAGACVELGHTCAIIALHDRHVTETVEKTVVLSQGKIPSLRFPSGMPWPKKIKEAVAFSSRFQPEAISLHIVSYGYHDKGIVLGLIPFFQELTADCPLHLMFHELWTGGEKLASIRQRLVGKLQKESLRQMISRLRPRWVTTSNPAYVSYLKQVGVRAMILPLFGNIPVGALESTHYVPARLIEAGVMRDGSERSAWRIGIFFGGLPQEWKPEPLMSLLRRTTRRSHKRIALVLVGRAGAIGEKVWKKLHLDYVSDFVFVNLAEQPVEMVSTLLQIADFGIAATPLHLLGKSSTVAAMLDHGLPVIVTRNDFSPPRDMDKTAPLDPLIHRCDGSLEAKLLVGLPKQPPRHRLGEIAPRFCEMLRESIDRPA